MLAGEILKDKGGAVFSIPPETTVEAACTELTDRRVGALVVCEADRVVGVFSERDVARAVARDGVSALSRPVASYMTAKVIFAGPGDTVEQLMARMTDRRIRHLPIMKEDRLIGVVSIGDVVKARIDESMREAESLRTYIAAG